MPTLTLRNLGYPSNSAVGSIARAQTEVRAGVGPGPQGPPGATGPAGAGGGTLAGDVTGASGTNTVSRIRGHAVAATAPTAGQVLQWNGTQWTPVNPPAGPAVQPPTITNLNPNTGPAAGGTSVVITGTNFTGATAVQFGATNATSFVVNSATQITAMSPAGTGGVNVTVTTPDGTSGGMAFTYAALTPTITSLNPNNGPAAGGTSVVITGTNFTGATAVNFGATAATSFVVNSATQITAVSPAGTGSVNVTVTTPNGTSGGMTFTYAAALVAPIITSSNTANATEDALFTYTITASGNPAPTTFDATGLPAWLTRTGAVVSGTPPAGSAPGPVTFTVTATNSEGTSPGVVVTVSIAEAPAGWSIEWTFPVVVNIIPPAGNIPLHSIPGWDPAWDVDMDDDLLYDLPTMADMPVNLFVKFWNDTTWVGPIHFNNWGPGTAAPNSIRNWGFDSANHRISISGSNSTSQPIQLRLVKH